MLGNIAVKIIGISAATVVLVGISSACVGGHARANGDIIGMVEMGANRVSNAVVSLEGVSGSFSAPSQPVIMNQQDKAFEPHVLAVMKGTTVQFKNSDPYLHNVFSNSRVKMFNVSQANKGDVSELTFDKVGLIPIKCHIHASMKAYIVVLSNPYFAVTNEKGLFEIGNIPAGTYTLKVWSEHASPSTQSIEVTAGGRAKAIVKLVQ